MESDHDEPLFTNHVTLLFSLILPKCSWTKKNVLGEQVLWSDERKTKLFRHNELHKILHKKSKAFLSKNTVPTLKHRDSSMMFCGSFSSRGTGQLIAESGIMKSEDYIKILSENRQQTVKNLHLGQQFTLQQDNDHKHTSKYSKLSFIFPFFYGGWGELNKIKCLASYEYEILRNGWKYSIFRGVLIILLLTVYIKNKQKGYDYFFYCFQLALV